MAAMNKGNAKKGRSRRSFQPQFRKKERCTGCLPNAAGWARGHLEEIGKSRMETRQEEKEEGKVMKIESGKSTHQHQSSGSSSSSTFKTRSVSGKWEMEKDWEAKLSQGGDDCDEDGNVHS